MLWLLGGRRGHGGLEDGLEGRGGEGIEGGEGAHGHSGEVGKFGVRKGIVASLGWSEKTHVNRYGSGN